MKPRLAFACLSLSFLVCTAAGQFTPTNAPPPWSEIRSVKMSGGLRVFWDVGGGDLNSNRREAVAHGFEIVDLLNTYADYPGQQKQAIRVAQPDNPWKRPDYFTNIIQRNIADRGNKNAICVHDIEFHFEENVEKAWTNSAVRAVSGATTLEGFREGYFREWAQWFALPCRWAKEQFPRAPIGLYGAQPFRRDYWGVAGKSAQQIDGTHRTDGELWRHIDPFVDFYIASVYFFFEDPGSIFYLASNVEENVARTRPLGNKPLYAYEWMRYHDSNQALRGQELSPWLVEAMAVVPYFCGARGVVLWGWEPKAKGQYYHRLPLFMESLARVADHSEKIGRAQLIAADPAPTLWKEKRPLVRKLRVSADEWFVLAVNPWQPLGQSSTVEVQLGTHTVDLEVRGRHSEIYHCSLAGATRVDMSLPSAPARKSNATLRALNASHSVVYHHPRQMAAWPANGGLWTWDNGDEALVGFCVGAFKEQSGHNILPPYTNLLARTRDGGETWGVELPASYAQESSAARKLLTPVDFFAPGFAMRMIAAGYHGSTNGRGGFLFSNDRGRTWNGPFHFTGLDSAEALRGWEITTRTDYTIDSSSRALLLMSARQSQTWGDRLFAARTTDGGRRFQFVNWIVPPSDPYRAVMPATVRCPSGKLITAVRRRELQRDHCWLDAYRSEDQGGTWIFLSKIAETGKGNGNPPALLRLRNGQIFCVYGNRDRNQMLARSSRDEGATWDDEIILRDDYRPDKFGNSDLGYPRLFQRRDGQLVAVYYWADAAHPEPHIAATRWTPSHSSIP